MTVQEMSDSVLMKLDKPSSFTLAAFEPEDIVYWLNIGQDELVKAKMFGGNNNPLGYGEGLKRMEDLSPLVKHTSKLDFGTDVMQHPYYSNVGYIDVSSKITDYLYYINSSIVITDPIAPTSTKTRQGQLIEESAIKHLIATSYNSPALRECYIYLKKGSINVIYDPFATINSMYVSYLKKPDILVTGTPSAGETNTSELPEHVHDEIVNLTVFLMLENIESDRLQSNLITLNNRD